MPRPLEAKLVARLGGWRTALLLIGMLAFGVGFDLSQTRYALLDPDHGVQLAVWGGLVAAALLTLWMRRRRPAWWGGWRRAVVLALVVGLGGAVSIIGVTLVNGVFAHGAHELRARVVAIDVTRMRRGTRHSATLTAEDGTTVRIHLGGPRRALDRGDVVTVVIGEGALGLPFVKDVRALDGG